MWFESVPLFSLLERKSEVTIDVFLNFYMFHLAIVYQTDRSINPQKESTLAL